MERGSFDVRLPLEAQNGLGELSLALCSMAESVGRRIDEAARLSDLAQKVNAGLMLGDVLGHVFASFRSVIPYERIGFSVLDEDRSHVRAVWARSLAGPTRLPPGYHARLSGSSLQKILETGRPRILNDLPAYLEDHPGSESTRLILAEGIRSSLTCPLVAS